MKDDSIPLCRSVFKHWIYEDAEYLKVWLTMLGRARYLHEEKTVVYRNVIVKLKYGEFIFGYKQWEKDARVSIQRLRTLIKMLKADGMIQESQATSHFTVFLIVNYQKFNTRQTDTQLDVSDDSNIQPASSQHPANIQPTTNKEGNKKVKNDKNVYTEFVSMSEPEHQKLVDKFGEQDTAERIDRLNNWYGQNPANMKKSPNAYYTILAWARRDEKANKQQSIKDFI